MKLNRSSITICLLVLSTGLGGLLVSWCGLYLYLSPKLPTVETLREVKFQTPLRIYSADRKLIGEFGNRRVPVKLTEVPPFLIKAFIAAEDDSFYSHSGVDPMGILRAASHLLLGTGGGGGGSTLTMQVAKNSFLDDDEAQLLFNNKGDNTFLKNDGSLLYKAVQILLALKIEEGLTKDEILEIYLNQIFLGYRSYGVQAAAQTYYGKDIGQLTLSEAAVIAGIPPAPSNYNPIAGPEQAFTRRGYVLRRMLDLGYINQSQFDLANAEAVESQHHGSDPELSSPYVREMARIYMEDTFGKKASETQGFSVHTTIDSRLQTAAQQAVIDGLLEYDERHGYRGPELTLQPQFADEPAPADDSELSILNNEGIDDDADNVDAEAEEELRLYTLLQKSDDSENVSEAEEADAANPLNRGYIVKHLNLTPWLQELDSIPTYAGLQPAAILQAEDQHIEALLKDGRIITIPWENGPSTTGPYLNERYEGPSYKSAEEFLNLGDVVRVREPSPGEWYFSQLPEAQAAFVALDPNNGAVRALVGGLDFNQSNFNRVTSAKRPPGSNIKPLLYTAALENGFTAGDIIYDMPFTRSDASIEGDWRPQNDDGKFEGPMSLREALYRSRNVVSVRILDRLGNKVAFGKADRFGIDPTELTKIDLSRALGTYPMTPMQVATAYARFANGGFAVDNYFIERVEGIDGEIIFEAKPVTVCLDCEKKNKALKPEDEINLENVTEQHADPSIDELEALLLAELEQLNSEATTENNSEQQKEELQKELPVAPRVIDERTAYIIDDILKDVIKKGTGYRARSLGRNDIAGKTGTTNESTDAWFTGYNHKLVASAWIGFDQYHSLGNEYGGKAAQPIWIKFMEKALRGVPEINRPMPDGLKIVRINSKTGKATGPNDPDAVMEIFRVENAPEVKIDSDPDEILYEREEVHPDEIF